MACPTSREADQTGVRSLPRAPLVTRLGGQAVRGQRNRRPYPCSRAMSTPGGPVRPVPHPGDCAIADRGCSGACGTMMPARGPPPECHAACDLRRSALPWSEERELADLPLPVDVD